MNTQDRVPQITGIAIVLACLYLMERELSTPPVHVMHVWILVAVLVLGAVMVNAKPVLQYVGLVIPVLPGGRRSYDSKIAVAVDPTAETEIPVVKKDA